MAEKDKKYYWLKLKNDFFKRHDIRIIEGMTNGKDYVLFYLKLLVESVGHDGELRFSDTIPYNEEMLSTVTNTNVDVVRSAVKIFRELDMMEILDDGTIYLQEVQKMIGHESYWADQKRKQRTENPMPSLNVGHCPTDVQLVQPMSKQELEKELEKELDLDIEEEIESTSTSNAVDNVDTVDKSEIFTLYEQEIGFASPLIVDDIVDYLLILPKDIIVKAIQEASIKNIKNFAYIKAILERCKRENIRTLADYENKQQKKKKKDEPEVKPGKYAGIFNN